MKKILLSLVYCFLAVNVFGQQATWNALPADIKSWGYSFDDGTASSLKPNVPASGDNRESVSTSEVRGVLPKPSSGTMLLKAGSGQPEFSVNGVTDTLLFRASTATNQNIGKFAAYNIDNATAITSVNFTVNFSAGDAEWILALGNTTAGGIFVSTSSFTGGSTAGRENAFTSLRWVGGNLEFGTHAGSAAPTYNQIATYAVNTNYRLEILLNNSASTQYYTKNNEQHAIATKKLHLWVNDTAVEISGSKNLSLSGTTTSATAINSLMLQSKNPTSSGGSLDVATISSLNFQSVSETTLPVSLTSFIGKAVNSTVLLNWQTISESNNSHFDILRFSPENQNPVKIGEVTGKNNSNVLVNYSFSDKQPLAGVNYYQLRQVDFDGKTTLSAIVSVKVGLNDAQFYVYQSSSGNYHANFYSESAAVGVFALLDVNGRVLNSLNAHLQKGNNTIVLNDKSLNPGIYLSRVVANGEEIIKKFIVR